MHFRPTTSYFAIVGLGAAPGVVDSPDARRARRDVAACYLDYHAGVEYVDVTGTYGGVAEPGLLLSGEGAYRAALTLGAALGQESIFYGALGFGALAFMDGRPEMGLGRIKVGRSPDGDGTEGPTGPFYC